MGQTFDGAEWSHIKMSTTVSFLMEQSVPLYKQIFFFHFDLNIRSSTSKPDTKFSMIYIYENSEQQQLEILRC